ncbi:hypothetical protein [Parabacteroides sp. ZJ-118]|uniref:hypothetical protein n=1 Tax=Parabacteroides sp. ZJ-118 TaxID=2709398 RepID=UPI0013EA8B0A|nr:hypothetical protein [Parabacteroides sp. ZJ-118]
MNFKSLFVLGAVLCGFASCESSLDEDNLMLSNSTQENVETKSLEGESQSFTLYASYKGTDYTVSCERRNDSIIYLDETFKGKTHSDSNLDNVPCGDDSWSDKITSFTFSIEEVGKYTQSPHSR